MPRRAIPPEVLDAIVDLVAVPLRLDSYAERDEVELAKKTVASCALVSRQWRDIAQEHQYHDLVVEFRDLESSPNGRTMAGFSSFIAGSSRLSATVRALQLQRSRKHEEMPDGVYDICRPIDIRDLVNLIIHFKRLQHLYLCFASVDLLEEEDTTTSRNHRIESLTRFSCRPDRSFRGPIHDHFLNGLLAHFVDVREITLESLILHRSTRTGPVCQMHFNSLTHVVIRRCFGIGGILGRLQTAAQGGLPALELLDASYLDFTDLPILRGLLSTLGPRLKYFGMIFLIVPWENVEPDYSQLHLAACPNLRGFEFAAQDPSETEPWNLYVLLTRILEQTLEFATDSTALALESVTIFCEQDPVCNDDNEWNLAPGSMTALEDALLRFPSMRRLEFKLPPVDNNILWGFMEQDEDRAYFAGLMPKLDEKGMLMF